MHIEQATEKDVAAIADLWHSGWHQGHAKVVPAELVASRTLEEFIPRVRTRISQTFVAKEAGKLAGFYILAEDELYQFYVDAAFQGRGVAGELMRSAEAALAGQVAWLACSVGNDRAAGFYRKAGWEQGDEETYSVETSLGSQEVTVWRFEKDLR